MNRPVSLNATLPLGEQLGAAATTFVRDAGVPAAFDDGTSYVEADSTTTTALTCLSVARFLEPAQALLSMGVTPGAPIAPLAGYPLVSLPDRRGPVRRRSGARECHPRATQALTGSFTSRFLKIKKHPHKRSSFFCCIAGARPLCREGMKLRATTSSRLTRRHFTKRAIMVKRGAPRITWLYPKQITPSI